MAAKEICLVGKWSENVVCTVRKNRAQKKPNS